MMSIRNTLKYWSLVGCFTFSFVKLSAQPWSYIFIQADKDLQYNIKMNNQMLPQYGKHYSIIGKLTPGTVKLYLLFPRNDYSPQRFMIDVPDKGFRNFLLTYYEGAISLYDIQNLIYQHGETVTAEQIAADMPEKRYSSTSDMNSRMMTDTIITEISDSSLLKKTAKKEPSPVVAEKKIADSSALADYYNNPVNNPKTTIDKPIPKEEKPNIEVLKKDTSSIEDIFGEATKKAKAKAGKYPAADPISLPDYWALHPSEKPVAVNDNSTKAPVAAKGKCSEPLAEKIYDDIYINALQKNDKERLKFLISNLKNCFSTNQLRVLTITLATDPERYAFLKQAYYHVTDKANFAALESTLIQNEWKDYFRLLIQ